MKTEVHFSEQAYKSYSDLPDGSVRRSVDRLKTTLLNPHYGDHIPRDRIPKNVARRFGTDRIWKANVAEYWRLLYTVIGETDRVVVLVLAIVSHPEYDRMFDYRKR